MKNNHFDKKIAIVIYYFEGHVGGHFYTVKTLTESFVSSGIDCELFVIGKSIPNIYESNDFNVTLLSELDFFFKRKKLDNIFEQFDVLHSFDNLSNIFVTSLRLKNKLLINTLCGGPDPKRPYHLISQNQICLSQENIEYFERSGFKFDRLLLIPNRVSLKNSPLLHSNERELFFHDKSVKIIAINRIGYSFRSKIRQAINFSKLLHDRGVEVELAIVGYIENKDVYNELLETSNPSYVNFYTTQDYTNNATRHIKQSDVVIGTGRGFMEGALLGKVMLCPSQQLDYPVIVTEENFASLFSKNFSGRQEVDEKYEVDKLRSFKLEYYKSNLSLARTYEDNFLIDKAIDKYKVIYSESAEKNRFSVRFFIGYIYVLFKVVKNKVSRMAKR
ncbi:MULTISPECIES: hypothetical protein [unclassified Vibrio]|uniref:hypothetical protein n=1 Tax=unclassified Vibrio TaxID=2614977 RepID=UPI00354CEEE5